jgi:Ribbon-helix-helix protein, copG family
MASKHLTIRIDPDVFERLDRESRRQRVSRSELARTLLEEGLRMEAHPGIIFRDGPTGRRAGLKNGPDVWEVIGGFPRGKVSEAGIPHAAKTMALGEWQVGDAIRYYFEFSHEIDAWIRMVDEEAERAQAAWRKEQQGTTH